MTKGTYVHHRANLQAVLKVVTGVHTRLQKDFSFFFFVCIFHSSVCTFETYFAVAVRLVVQNMQKPGTNIRVVPNRPLCSRVFHRCKSSLTIISTTILLLTASLFIYYHWPPIISFYLLNKSLFVSSNLAESR